MTSTTSSQKLIPGYFPPSPTKDQDDKEESTSIVNLETTAIPTKTAQCFESPGSDLSNCSVVITPQSTPEKDGNTEKEKHTDIPTVKESPDTNESTETNPIESEKESVEADKEKGDKQPRKPACKKALSDELAKETSTDLPPKSKKKGRKKKPDVIKPETAATEAIKSPPKPKASRKKHAEVKSHVMTEYYAVRRSDRRSKTDLEAEKLKDLQHKILNKVQDGLEVKDIPNKGRGVVATKAFKRGDFVVEYAGERIDMTKAKKREDKYSKDPTKGCYMYYFNFKNENYCIDATKESDRLGRLLNHSKTAGNCHTKLVDVNSLPHLILVASRDIAVGEELQYDYGDRSKAALESHPWLKS